MYRDPKKRALLCFACYESIQYNGMDTQETHGAMPWFRYDIWYEKADFREWHVDIRGIVAGRVILGGIYARIIEISERMKLEFYATTLFAKFLFFLLYKNQDFPHVGFLIRTLFISCSLTDKIEWQQTRLPITLPIQQRAPRQHALRLPMLFLAISISMWIHALTFISILVSRSCFAESSYANSRAI